VSDVRSWQATALLNSELAWRKHSHSCIRILRSTNWWLVSSSESIGLVIPGRTTVTRCCGGFAISAPWYKWLYLLTYLLTHIIIDSFATWWRDMTRYNVTAPPPYTQFNTPPVRAEFAVGTAGRVLLDLILLCNSESCMASSISLLFPLSPKMPVLSQLVCHFQECTRRGQICLSFGRAKS